MANNISKIQIGSNTYEIYDSDTNLNYFHAYISQTQRTGTDTVQGNSAKNISWTLSTSTHTPVGIVNFNTGDGYTYWSKITFSGGRLYNTDSSAHTCGWGVTFLLARTH